MKTTPTLLAMLALLMVLPAPARAEDAPFDAALSTASRDLEQLEDLLDDSHSTNRAVITYMDEVMKSATSLEPPSLSPEGGATEPTTQKHEHAAWVRSVEDIRDAAVDLLLDALSKRHIDRSGRNERRAVNEHAGQLLAKAASFLPEKKDRERLSRRIIRKLKRFARSRHPVAAEVYEGAFGALASLGDPDSLEWLMSNYLHTRKQPEAVKRLRAALRSMRKFESIPGRLRHALVDEMLKKYVAVEGLAEQSSTDVSAVAAKRFWDQVRVDVVPLMQYAAGYPKREDGTAMIRMQAFAVWFRDHDNPRAPPWTTSVDEGASG